MMHSFEVVLNYSSYYLPSGVILRRSHTMGYNYLVIDCHRKRAQKSIPKELNLQISRQVV